MEYKMVDRLTSPKVIRELLTGRNLAPRKSLGQNFLIDANIREKIIAAASINKHDLVVEIGPGLGALTGSLFTRAGKVIAIEYDKGLYAVLQEIFGNQNNILLLNQDFLETDLLRLLEVYREEEYHYKVIANLPYYITTPVIFKLIQSGINWESMVFMVQKEVADRICAGPGNKDYGALTVMLSFYGKPAKVSNVPKTVFYPTPKVDSVVIKISAYHFSPDEDTRNSEIFPYLQRVVQAAFGQRRKTILNALDPLGGYFGSKPERVALLHKLGIDPIQRGETLSLQHFLAIAKEMRSRARVLDFKPEPVVN